MATYFNDCSSLSGWTFADISGSHDYSDSTGEIVKSSSNVDCLYLNSVESDSERQDVEILVRVRIATLPTTVYIAIVRGSDSDSLSSAAGYTVAIRSTALRTYSKVGGVFTQISSASVSHSTGTDYWVRLRVNQTGNIVKARSWADGGGEGGTWDCDSTDTAVGVVDGYCGLQGALTTAEVTWSACGVGTNGDTAPASAGGGYTHPTLSAAAMGSLTSTSGIPQVHYSFA